MKHLRDILPLFAVENNAILSKQGDITVAYEVTLPEIFTLSDAEYETLHQSLVRAIKVLPRHSIFHKQDWFTESGYQANFESADISFLSRSSERFFHERPYLDHHCYMLLTKKPVGRKPGSSLFSNLLRRSIVPEQTLKPQMLQDFLDSVGQFEKILLDSGFLELKRLNDVDLSGDEKSSGLIERYLNLNADKSGRILKDISFKEEIRIGGGLLVLLILFAILYIYGINTFLCLGIILALGTFLFIYVYKLSHQYGEFGLMKKLARKSIPKEIKSYSRKPFTSLNKTVLNNTTHH